MLKIQLCKPDPISTTTRGIKEYYMNPILNKSIQRYIEECISQFEYNDFSPPIDNGRLLSKFAEILYKENAYWEKYNVENEWQDYLFIQFKSFENYSRKILGLCIVNNEIIFVPMDSFPPIETKNKTTIRLLDIWLDHDKLVQKFLAIVKDSVTKSNPP
jgi:hypothetical protein